MERKAIVTIAIGTKYIDMFNNICRSYWTQYANKFGFDLIVITDPLDTSERARRRSPAWQKLLICSQDWSHSYDQLVWIDTDVLINFNNSPDISQDAPIEKISAVEAWSIPSSHIHDLSLKRLYSAWDREGGKYLNNLSPNLYYKNRGIDANEVNSVVQTGVFVCSPSHHRELFEYIYHSYEDGNGPEWNYEMPAMSYEIIKGKFQHWIQPEFNYCVPNITAAFYPFIFKSSDSVSIVTRAMNKLRRISRTPDALGRNQILALSNIYELGFFTHFASCSSLMIQLHHYLDEQRHP